MNTKAKQKYERPRTTHNMRLSHESIFHLRMIAAHDNKAQGEIIEEWARVFGK
jgi:hypothetical protein